MYVLWVALLFVLVVLYLVSLWLFDYVMVRLFSAWLRLLCMIGFAVGCSVGVYLVWGFCCLLGFRV